MFSVPTFYRTSQEASGGFAQTTGDRIMRKSPVSKAGEGVFITFIPFFL